MDRSVHARTGHLACGLGPDLKIFFLAIGPPIHLHTKFQPSIYHSLEDRGGRSGAPPGMLAQKNSPVLLGLMSSKHMIRGW